MAGILVYDVRLHVKMQEAQKEKLAQYAKAKGKSAAEVVREFIDGLELVEEAKVNE